MKSLQHQPGIWLNGEHWLSMCEALDLSLSTKKTSFGKPDSTMPNHWGKDKTITNGTWHSSVTHTQKKSVPHSIATNFNWKKYHLQNIYMGSVYIALKKMDKSSSQLCMCEVAEPCRKCAENMHISPSILCTTTFLEEGKSRERIQESIGFKVDIFVCFVLGPQSVMFRSYFSFALGNYSWQCSGNHVRCWGSNLGLCCMQSKYPICYTLSKS